MQLGDICNFNGGEKILKNQHRRGIEKIENFVGPGSGHDVGWNILAERIGSTLLLCPR